MIAPLIIERGRGRVRPQDMAVWSAMPGAVGGALSFAAHVGFGARAMHKGPIGDAVEGPAVLGALAGGLLTPMWWMPFMVATMTRSRSWTTTVGVGAGVPLAVAACAAAWTLLP